MLLSCRETTISWDADEKIMEIKTNDPAMIQRMDVLCEHGSRAYRCVNKTGQSAFYTAPANLITFRFPTLEELNEQRRRNTSEKAHSRPSEAKKKRL